MPSVGGFSPRLGFGVPVILAAVVAVIGIADLISGYQLASLMAWSNAAAAQGQLWRALTWVLVSGSILGLIINILMVLVIGSAVDGAVGGARTAALYFLSGLGGAAAIALLGGPNAAGIGAGAALFGLLGANAALKFRQGADIRPDLIMFGLLVVMNVVLGGMAGSLSGLFGLVGGVLGGTAGGVIIGWAPAGRHRELNQWLLLVGAAVACAALIGVGLTA